MPLVYLTEEEMEFYILSLDREKAQRMNWDEGGDRWNAKEEQIVTERKEKLQVCLKGEEGISKEEIEHIHKYWRCGFPGLYCIQFDIDIKEKLKGYLGE